MKPWMMRKYKAQFVFIMGLALMILGSIFLIGSLDVTSSGEAPIFLVFFSFLLVIVGAFYAIRAAKLSKQSASLFLAFFLLMSGIFLFISALGIVPFPLSRAWPLLSVFSGLAMLLVGWRRCGSFRPRYFVSSCALVLLGFGLLVFYLKIVPFSFANFIRSWWPLLFLLGCLTLALISFTVKGERRE
jgi:hypothetical protein